MRLRNCFVNNTPDNDGCLMQESWPCYLNDFSFVKLIHPADTISNMIARISSHPSCL